MNGNLAHHDKVVQHQSLCAATLWFLFYYHLVLLQLDIPDQIGTQGGDSSSWRRAGGEEKGNRRLELGGELEGRRKGMGD